MYGKCGRFTVEKPMVLGHEASGTVVKLGTGVKHLNIGDRVAIEPGVPCRKCKLCKTGRYNLCKDVFFCATPPDDGNLCRFYTHAADFCYKLPDNMTLDEGALIEPLAVGIYSSRRANIGLGDKLLICGADIDNNRLSMAKSLGADYTIKVTTSDPKELANQIEDVMGCQPDATIECSGTDFSMRTGIYATYPGGSVILVGRGSADAEVPLTLTFCFLFSYPAAIEFIKNGFVNVKPLISHHFALKDTVQAFETARSRDSKAVKVMIHCDQ
ncbi:hypothetical protein KUTeg_006095 [Tegillarca granosa]|uniref:Sorbitol dehydrogenase n=1 Tax=Tegillarca granosa TaxID=220873 RepID=A0ABQ9FHD8_TEGGR|nr:hypothetical protein KUTeg_006095 [Tegillarca granosa]